MKRPPLWAMACFGGGDEIAHGGCLRRFCHWRVGTRGGAALHVGVADQGDSKALDEPQGQWRLVLVGCQVILLKTIERPWPQKPGKTGHRPATLPVKANFWTGSPWRGKRKALLERG